MIENNEVNGYTSLGASLPEPFSYGVLIQSSCPGYGVYLRQPFKSLHIKVYIL